VTHDEAIGLARIYTRNEGHPFGVTYDQSIMAPAKERFSVVAMENLERLSKEFPSVVFLHSVQPDFQ
jgi:hypothetical protein